MLALRSRTASRTVIALVANCSDKNTYRRHVLVCGTRLRKSNALISTSTLVVKSELWSLSKTGKRESLPFDRSLQRAGSIRPYCSHSQSCSNCDAKTWNEKTGIVCDNCDAILNPPNHANHFKLLGIRESFDVDDTELTQKFRRMQTQLHPDRFAAKSEKERALSEQWSSRLNAAYQTLKKPLGRALYMLELRGIPLSEGDLSVDDEFLMTIMELNEQVAEVTSAKELFSLSKDNLASLNKYVKLVSDAFETNDLDVAREHVATMKYYANIQEKIIQKEEELGIVH